MSRYRLLRESVANLAASPDAQAAYLDHLFRNFPDAERYGNDELALEFDDIFFVASDMLDCGDLRLNEYRALQPIDEMLSQLSGGDHAEFWQRRALWDDPRWQMIRQCAAAALAVLPDERRENPRGGNG